MLTFQQLALALQEFTLEDRDLAHLTAEQREDVRERWAAIQEAFDEGDFEDASDRARHLQVAYPTRKLATLNEHAFLMLAFSRWVAALMAWFTVLPSQRSRIERPRYPSTVSQQAWPCISSRNGIGGGLRRRTTSGYNWCGVAAPRTSFRD
jgi:hypothetical protein